MPDSRRIDPRTETCKLCHREYTKIWANQKYCGSRAAKTGCSYEALRLKYKRWLEKDPNRLLRWIDLKPIKLKVKERDGNTCQMCGLYNGIPKFMDVDHKDGDRNNNILVNLWTLCPNCHRLKTIEHGDNVER